MARSHADYGLPPGAQGLFDMDMVADSKMRSPNQLVMAALSLYEPQEVHPLRGGPAHVDPANKTLKTQAVAETDQQMVWSGFYLTRRIRNYLTAVAGVQIPFCHVMAWRDLVTAGKVEIDPYAYCPTEVWVKEDRLVGWEDRLEQTPLIAENLLNSFPMGSPQDRALMLLGEARWILVSDVEDAFLLLWRALEVVGRMDFKSAKEQFSEGDRAPALPYLENHAGDLLEGSLTRISDRTKILVSVRNRRPGTNEEILKEMSELRAKLSHDSTSVHLYQRVTETIDELNAIARAVVRSVLPKGSLFPSFRED